MVSAAFCAGTLRTQKKAASIAGGLTRRTECSFSLFKRGEHFLLADLLVHDLR